MKNKVHQMVAKIRLAYGVKARNFNQLDFFRICEGEKIFFINDRFDDCCGIYILYRGFKFIFIDKQLKGEGFLKVAFHELGHHFLHRGEMRKHYFHKRQNLSIAEREADLFSEMLSGLKINRGLFSEVELYA